jgi:hypothetical protein
MSLWGYVIDGIVPDMVTYLSGFGFQGRQNFLWLGWAAVIQQFWAVILLRASSSLVLARLGGWAC